MMSKKLSPQQLEIARQFSGMKKNDFVQVDRNATRGDVLDSVLREQSKPNLQDILKQDSNPQVYQQKYQDKLLKAAKEKGYNSVEEMLNAKKEEENERIKEKARQAELELQKSKSAVSSTPNGTSGSYAKDLIDIVKIDMLLKEDPTRIAEIWNTYHSTRDALSASIDATFYQALYKRSKEYPMFVLPLAREDGYEMYLLQFQGHQVYFTPLIEYQTKKEGARPTFSITFYTELMAEKNVVLMLGELADKTSSFELKDAQHLVYQLQIFYVTGSEKQKSMVHKFWKLPQEFSYEELIASLQEMSQTDNK